MSKSAEGAKSKEAALAKVSQLKRRRVLPCRTFSALRTDRFSPGALPQAIAFRAVGAVIDSRYESAATE